MLTKRSYLDSVNDSFDLIIEELLTTRRKLKRYENLYDGINGYNAQKKLHRLYNHLNSFEKKVWANIKLSKKLKPLLCDPKDLINAGFFDFASFESCKTSRGKSRLGHMRSKSNLQKSVVDSEPILAISKPPSYSRLPSISADPEEETPYKPSISASITQRSYSRKSCYKRPRRKALSSLAEQYRVAVSSNHLDISQTQIQTHSEDKDDTENSEVSPNPISKKQISVELNIPSSIFSNSKLRSTKTIDNTSTQTCYNCSNAIQEPPKTPLKSTNTDDATECSDLTPTVLSPVYTLKPPHILKTKQKSHPGSKISKKRPHKLTL